MRRSERKTVADQAGARKHPGKCRFHSSDCLAIRLQVFEFETMQLKSVPFEPGLFWPFEDRIAWHSYPITLGPARCPWSSAWPGRQAPRAQPRGPRPGGRRAGDLMFVGVFTLGFDSATERFNDDPVRDVIAHQALGPWGRAATVDSARRRDRPARRVRRPVGHRGPLRSPPPASET